MMMMMMAAHISSNSVLVMNRFQLSSSQSFLREEESNLKGNSRISATTLIRAQSGSPEVNYRKAPPFLFFLHDREHHAETYYEITPCAYVCIQYKAIYTS
jgi:hypothetical protein